MKKFFAKNKKIIVVILITFLCLLVWRIGVHITSSLINPDANWRKSTIIGFLDVFTGGPSSQFSVVALGSALTLLLQSLFNYYKWIFPIFKEWAEESESWKTKVKSSDTLFSIIPAFVQGLAFIIGSDYQKKLEVALFAIDEQPHSILFT